MCNAAGGLVWGTAFLLLGYLAGNSYQRIAPTAGRGAAFAVVGIGVVALIIWRIRRRHGESRRPDNA